MLHWAASRRVSAYHKRCSERISFYPSDSTPKPHCYWNVTESLNLCGFMSVTGHRRHPGTPPWSGTRQGKLRAVMPVPPGPSARRPTPPGPPPAEGHPRWLGRVCGSGRGGRMRGPAAAGCGGRGGRMRGPRRPDARPRRPAPGLVLVGSVRGARLPPAHDRTTGSPGWAYFPWHWTQTRGARLLPGVTGALTYCPGQAPIGRQIAAPG